MEAKKKDEITVGSMVRFVKAKNPALERYIGETGIVVSVIRNVESDFCREPHFFHQKRLKIQPFCKPESFWCDEDQVQLVTSEKQKVPEPEATAHKFKVGDAVRVTNNPPAHMSRSSDGVLWISQMNCFCGRLYRIKRVRERGYSLNIPSEFMFSEEWLEPASPDKPKPSPKRTIVIEITDDGANAKYVCGEEVKKTASIKRHPDDKPDDENAAVLVTEKLFGRNLRDLEEAVDADRRLHKEITGWINGAREALDEVEKRVKKL